MAVRREYVSGLYRDLLGREGSEQEIEGHLNNPGGEQGLYDLFSSVASNNTDAQVNEATVGSPQQQAYQSQYQTQGETSNTMPIGTPPQTVRPTPAPYTGFTPRYDYSAFNTAREQDPGTSAKDAFAMLSNQAPPPPFASKPELTTWFLQNIRPQMDALGHRVLSVNDDGFTYTNHEGTFFVDFAQNAGAPAGSMLQRLQWNATPADAQTAARYPGASSGGAGSGGAGSGGGGTRPFQQQGQYYGGPGSPGIFNGPVQQVGQDPLSLLITGGLADFLERGGTTDFGEDIRDLILKSATGETPNDTLAKRYESARELTSKARRTMTNDARAALADRNLLSEPGIPQGAEIGAIGRIEEAIAPEFSRMLRDIFTDESTRADARQLASLQMATGMASDQARTFLAGIGEGTARQTALAQIALQSLSQNMAWSQFLAEFGLKRDQTLAMLQQGRVDDVMGLLNSFLSLASLSRGGYVGG